jgi:hypothetical protein
VLRDNWNQTSLGRHLTVLAIEADGDDEGETEGTNGLIEGVRGGGVGVLGRLDGEVEGELEVGKLGG